MPSPGPPTSSPTAVDWSRGLPAGTREPFYEYEPVRRGVVRIAGREIAVVLEGEERLWVDAAGTGDLRDDPWPVFDAQETRREREVELSVRYRGAQAPLPLRVRFYSVSDRPADRVDCLVVSGRRGKVRLGPRPVLVAVEDADSDGRFDGPSDVVYVDLDKDGALGPARDSREALRAGDVFSLGKSGFRVAAVDPAGRFVTFEEAAGETAPRPPLSAGSPLPSSLLPADAAGRVTVVEVGAAGPEPSLPDGVKRVRLAGGDAQRVLRVPGLSTRYLLDARGRIRAKHVGPHTLVRLARTELGLDPEQCRLLECEARR
ncbi:MAG: hypothetical protein ACE5JG_04815, partial [Planctomycetota bacterium]